VAAQDTLIDGAQAELQEATGLPITLPHELSLKAVVGSLYDLLPTDLRKTLQVGMNLAAQGVAQIVTTAITQSAVGAAYGSIATSIGGVIGVAIPGLGTVVGIGAALLVNQLGLFKPTQKPSDRACKTKVTLTKTTTQKSVTDARGEEHEVTTYDWKSFSQAERAAFKLSPLELLPYAYTKYITIRNAVEKERATRYCGKGAAIDRMYFWAGVVDRIARAFENDLKRFDPDAAVGALGLPKVKHLTKLYKAVPSEEYYFDPVSHKLTHAPSHYIADVFSPLIAALHERAKDLEALSASKFTVGASSALRWLIVSELQNATAQVVIDPGNDSSAWLTLVLTLYQKLLRLELSEQAAASADAANNKALYEAILKDPVAKAKLELESLRFNCAECGTSLPCPPCDELERRLSQPPAVVATRKVKVHVPKVAQS
jgi:hypothetical protein